MMKLMSLKEEEERESLSLSSILVDRTQGEGSHVQVKKGANQGLTLLASWYWTSQALILRDKWVV